MLWYICFFITVAVLLASVLITLGRRKSRIGIGSLFFGLLFATFFLHLPIHLYHVTENGAKNDLITAVLGAFVSIVQVITVNAEYFEFASEIIGRLEVQIFESIYLFIFGTVHFALPAVSAVTAVTFVLRCLAEFRVKLVNLKKRPVYVFSCINSRSVSLARDVKKKLPKSSILFASCSGVEKSEYNELKNEIHCDFQDDRIEELKLSAKNKQVYYFFISDDEEDNISSALSVLSRLSQNSDICQKNSHLFVFSEIEEMDTLIDSAEKGITDIRIVNCCETAVYSLLDAHPLYDGAKNNKISAMILGFDKISLAFLRAAAWCGQLSGYVLEMNVICEKENSLADHAVFAFPGLFSGRYNINIHRYENELEMEALVKRFANDTTYAVVTAENDTEALKRSLFLRRSILAADPLYSHMPFICVRIENDEKADLARNLHTPESKPERRISFEITPFGGIKDIYNLDSIVDPVFEKVSLNVHLVYEDIFSGGGIDVDSAAARYNLFEVNKRSNRANAMHIRYKLALIGLDYEESNLEDEVDFQEHLANSNPGNLTCTEHLRWMAFLESEGWTASDVEQAEKYKASGISKGRHNCPLLRLHPYICPFEELKARSDALGLPDSTVYDTELIRRIPDILHDKWGVSGKNYRIIKKR